MTNFGMSRVAPEKAVFRPALPLGAWPEVATLETANDVLRVRDSLPRLRAGDPLQAYRWALAMRLRRLRQIAAGRLDKAVVKRLFAMAGDLCPVCLQLMGPGSKRLKTLDHVVALANGGSNKAENLRVICNRCNSRKADRA